VKKGPRNNWHRPRSLREVVAGAESSGDIGDNLADFLDHMNLQVRNRVRRASLAAAIRAEPARTGNIVQDAYLAAIAVHLANTLRLPAPRWAQSKTRRLARPWFALPYAWARAELLRSSPAAFRERNLFTTEDALHRV
jgi:hypothetical protein